MAAPLLDGIEITHVLPCLADPSKIRFHAEARAALAEVLPYLNAEIRGAIYNKHVPALTFTREHRIICLHNRLVSGAKIDDVEDARAVCDWLVEIVNDAWNRRDGVEPSYERRERLTPLSIYKLLPGTNCRRCGLATCLAFAVELAAERGSIMHCGPLFAAELAGKRELLVTMLSDAGYEVPSAFRGGEEH